MFGALDISTSALVANRTRLDAISANGVQNVGNLSRDIGDDGFADGGFERYLQTGGGDVQQRGEDGG